MQYTSNLSNGRTVIPAQLRAELHLKDGDELIWTIQQGELVGTTRRAQLEKAQALFQKFVPPNSQSAADELIAERHLAAAQE